MRIPNLEQTACVLFRLELCGPSSLASVGRFQADKRALLRKIALKFDQGQKDITRNAVLREHRRYEIFQARFVLLLLAISS
jgi:hypothetical protein